MICVTHDQLEAMTLVNKIVVLNKGGVAPVGLKSYFCMMLFAGGITLLKQSI